MDNKPTLKERQLAWAIAWQDHGDRRALALLCASVEAFLHREANKWGWRMREELLAEYRLAVVEAANKYDRERPEGFRSLCAFHMQRRSYTVFKHAISPATLPKRVLTRAARVAISGDDEDGPVQQIVAPDDYKEKPAGTEILRDAIDRARLTAREWRAVQRFFNEETKEDLGALWGCTAENVLNYEKAALAKVRQVLQAKGLSLEDLL